MIKTVADATIDIATAAKYADTAVPIKPYTNVLK